MKILRISRPSEGFGIKDRVYYLEYRKSINSLLRKMPLIVLFLFPRLYLGIYNYPLIIKPQTGFLYPFLDPLPLNLYRRH
jgi:hypothetical protein